MEYAWREHAEKILNERRGLQVLMSEARQLTAGEAILSGARAAAEGRDEAIEDLVRQHARFAYRIAYAVLRSHHDAEDAVQETFVRVLRYARQLDAVENPKTWLARIVWRVAVDRSGQRNRRREVPVENDAAGPISELASAEVAADAALEGAQLSAALARLIPTLPRKLREPLILSTIEEMSPREAGAVLGINEAAVRSRVFRAKQILREKLSAEMRLK